MTRYAAGTDVSADKSQAEIKRTIHRYGAGGFFSLEDWDGGRSVIGFALNGLSVKITLELPQPGDRAYTHSPNAGRVRKPAAALKAWEQACRQRTAWHKQGLGPAALSVNVNVSKRQVGQPGFVDEVRKIIQETEIAGSCLKL